MYHPSFALYGRENLEIVPLLVNEEIIIMLEKILVYSQ
jgi:hypothetical protein